MSLADQHKARRPSHSPRPLPRQPPQATTMGPWRVDRSCDPAPAKLATCWAAPLPGRGDGQSKPDEGVPPLGVGSSLSPTLATCPKTP